MSYQLYDMVFCGRVYILKIQHHFVTKAADELFQLKREDIRRFYTGCS